MQFRSDETEQNSLFAFSVRDLVPKDSNIWSYIELFDSVDLSKFDNAYSGEGEVPLEPRLMLRTIFYGLTNGVVSGRKLMDRCRYDNRFLVLSGNQRPDRRSFDRFVNRHSVNFSLLMKDIVELAREKGLVNLGQISIDGSRFKAHTSPNKVVRYDKIDKTLNHIENRLKELKKNLSKENKIEIREAERKKKRIEEAKKKIEDEYSARTKKHRSINNCSKSLNDIDAQSMSHKSESQGFKYGYNVQVAVAGESQIIVSEDIHDSATDYQALPKLLDKIEADYDTVPDKVLVDRGYKSHTNLRELEERGIEGFVGVTGPKEDEIEIQDIEYLTPEKDIHSYRCMSGKVVPIDGRRKDGRTQLKFKESFCQDCEHQDKCKLFGKKTLNVPERSDFLRLVKLYQRSRTEEYKQIYARRKACVEPVFGNMKYNKLFMLYVVGKKKVSTKFTMMCIAHNIEKIINKSKNLPHYFNNYIETVSKAVQYFTNCRQVLFS
jgi:transposase